LTSRLRLIADTSVIEFVVAGFTRLVVRSGGDAELARLLHARWATLEPLVERVGIVMTGTSAEDVGELTADRRDRKPPLEPRSLFAETCRDIHETGHGRLVVAGAPDGSDG
jgi:hypothetical protein